MSSTTSSSGEDPKVRAQRSPLASQRDREAGSRAGGGYFPLGYKDGFSQWVSVHRSRICSDGAGCPLTQMNEVGEHFTDGGGAHGPFIHTISATAP